VRNAKYASGVSAVGSAVDQGAAQKAGDGLRQLSRTIGLRRCECQTSSQAMTGDAKFLEEVRTSPQCVLRKYRVPETRFHQSLNCFGVIGFHHHTRRHADFAEKFIYYQPHVASLGIEQKWQVGPFRGPHRADMSAANFVCRGANDKQLFIKQRNKPEVGFGNGERDERQIEAAIEQAGNHLLRYANGHPNFGI
jgi:hypothetical protein